MSASTRAEVRDAALRPFAFLGLELDEERNALAQPDCDVAADGSAVHVMVIRAQEEWAIARAAVELVTGRRSARSENGGARVLRTAAG